MAIALMVISGYLRRQDTSPQPSPQGEGVTQDRRFGVNICHLAKSKRNSPSLRGEGGGG